MSLLEKKYFYSHLNMINIALADYNHVKRVCKGFKINNLGEYHDFYAQSDTLLLADVFEDFQNTSFEIHEVNLDGFFTVPELAWQAALEKSRVKLGLSSDIDMLLMVEKGIREGTFHALHRYAKANSKYMKDYDQNKELPYLKYWDVNNLYGWVKSQTLPTNGFKMVEEHFDLMEML